MNKDCVIVIPIYKYDLYDYELLSINRILDLYINRYNIIYLIPNDFDIVFFLNKNKLDKYYTNSVMWYVISYDPYFFTSSLTYNKICMSSEFYSHFFNYKYMFLYQLDAYVFNDELEYWLSKDYDFIGSYERFMNNYILQVIKSVLDNPDDYNYDKKGIMMNGGVSLRKIQSCYKFLNQNKLLCDRVFYDDSHVLEEDGFLSFVEETSVSALDAIKFGYSHMCFDTSYAVNDYKYPFVCHSLSHSIRLREYVYKFNLENNIIYEN